MVFYLARLLSKPGVITTAPRSVSSPGRPHWLCVGVRWFQVEPKLASRWRGGLVPPKSPTWPAGAFIKEAAQVTPACDDRGQRDGQDTMHDPLVRRYKEVAK